MAAVGTGSRTRCRHDDVQKTIKKEQARRWPSLLFFSLELSVSGWCSVESVKKPINELLRSFSGYIIVSLLPPPFNPCQSVFKKNTSSVFIFQRLITVN